MITYESICEKLGFDPIEWSINKNRETDIIDDSTWINDKLKTLNMEEILFLMEYCEKHEPMPYCL